MPESILILRSEDLEGGGERIALQVIDSHGHRRLP